MLGPVQIPPQGARALVRGLLRGGGRRRPEVTATFDESERGAPVLELLNVGDATAADIHVVLAGVDRAVGDLAPDASLRLHVAAATDDCSWSCRDGRGRLRRWRYA